MDKFGNCDAPADEHQTAEAASVEPEATANVSAALSVLGGKWKLLVLWHLKDKPQRFGELRRHIKNRHLQKISEKMLICTLRELEDDGIIDRTLVSQNPLKVEYSCSEYGKTLTPIILSLRDWGGHHRERQAALEKPQ